MATERDVPWDERPITADGCVRGLAYIIFAFIGLGMIGCLCASISDQGSEPPQSTTREQAIHDFVDREVERHWEPGGNSKEDAKWLTRDILNARTPAELERVMEFHRRNGR